MATTPVEPTDRSFDHDRHEDARDDALVRAAIQRAQRGEMEAIRFLYACYSGEVLISVKGLVKDSYEAEDITQEVFIKLIRVIPQYMPREGVPFGAWVRRVARNVAYDHLRSRQPTPCEELNLHHQGGQADHERRRNICEALDSLPQEQRDVVTLRHIFGLSPLEIANLLGKSESAVHGLHHRGRYNLRISLTKLGATPVVGAARTAGRRECPDDSPAAT